MATGLVNRLVPASALSLGVTRAVIHGTCLLAVLTTSFSALGELPVTILRPTGIMKLVPWSIYDRLLTPGGMTTLKVIMSIVLLLGCVGLFTPISTKVSLVLVIFYQGILRSFGHFNHDEMIAIYFLAVVAFTPCGDDFSIDQKLRKNPRTRPAVAYSFPILLMWMLMAWVYFSSAVVKLRVAGLKYLSPDNLPALAIFHSLDNLHDTQFKFAFMLPQFRSVLPFAVGFVLLWELFFPLVIISRKLRWWILAIGILFHVATLFTMNIFFPYQLAMYLVFVDWERVAMFVRRLRSVETVPSPSQ